MAASIADGGLSLAGADGIGDCAYMFGMPATRGRIRATPADFRVEEQLGFVPSGTGAHFWMRIEKTLLNTLDVVHLLARSTGVSARDIGISGQKDRNAVTSQWFSVPVGNQPAAREDRIRHCCDQGDGIYLQTLSRNPGKLKRGSHRRNDFTIVVHELEGDLAQVRERIEQIRVAGFPNYFGPQRFGRGGRNLATAGRLFRGDTGRIDRMARSMAMSSARSWIFNQVLSVRLQRFAIDEIRIGDAVQLDGTNAFFVHDGSDRSVVDRIAEGDLHATGPLWGGGPPLTGGEITTFEATVAEGAPDFIAGLVAAGMKHQRRALRVIPGNFNIEWETGRITLGFSLPSGAFATSLLRELVIV